MRNTACTDCDSSDAMHDYGTHTFCFSCKKRRYKDPDLDFEEYFPRFLDIEPPTPYYELPHSRTDRFPKEALAIMLRAGLDKPLRVKYDLTFVTSEDATLETGDTIHLKNRIIIPIRDPLGDLCGYQARAVDQTDIKYFTVGPKHYPTYKPDKTNDKVGESCIILTEDCFSAIRICEAGYNALSLLGTSIPDKLVLTLSKKYVTIIIWMDDDKPGKTAAAKLQKRFQLYAKNVLYVKKVREAKLCSKEEIIKTYLDLVANS